MNETAKTAFLLLFLLATCLLHPGRQTVTESGGGRLREIDEYGLDKNGQYAHCTYEEVRAVRAGKAVIVDHHAADGAFLKREVIFHKE